MDDVCAGLYVVAVRLIWYLLEQLSQTIVNLLKKLKISFAESCTGGLLSSSITSISGSSKAFVLGLVTYSNKAKINILKFQKNNIKTWCCKL